MGVTTKRALETQLNNGQGEVLEAMQVVLQHGTARAHGTEGWQPAVGWRGTCGAGDWWLRKKERILQDNWREELGQEIAKTFRIKIKVKVSTKRDFSL